MFARVLHGFNLARKNVALSFYFFLMSAVRWFTKGAVSSSKEKKYINRISYINRQGAVASAHIIINRCAVFGNLNSRTTLGCVTQTVLPGSFVMSETKQVHRWRICSFNTPTAWQISMLKAQPLDDGSYIWSTQRSRVLSPEWWEDRESLICCLCLWISFERLLLHAVCQYMDLVSASEWKYKLFILD